MFCFVNRFAGACLRALACLVLVSIAARAQAPTDIRVALVIGNSAYRGTAALVNPASDAAAMTATLQQLGFSVIEVKDASRAQMIKAVETVRDKLRGMQGVALLYYAGHGLQLDWHNYMLPVDASPRTAPEVAPQSVDVDTVLEAFKSAGTRLNIVVLDACRDNPFASSVSGKGLAPMDAPAGTFLAYATAPGAVAQDGAGSNGLYTGHLVRELLKPAVRIEDIFKRVRLQVRQDSKGRQIPWESTSLEEDFYFGDQPRSFPAAEAGRAETQGIEQEAADFGAVKDSRNPDDFYQFLKKYPSGLLAELAQFRLDQLQKAPVVAVPSRNGVAALPSGSWRYFEGDELQFDIVDAITRERRRIIQRVTYADAQRVEINGGKTVWDQMGGVLRNRFGNREIPVVIAPSDMYLGKKWRSAGTLLRSTGREDMVFWNAKVVALEEIEVPAGKFKAYRVERSGESRHPDGVSTFLNGTLWIDPSTMLVLRNDLLFRRRGKVTENSSQELAAVRQVPREQR